jgi:tryptophan synthase alpha chain
VNRVSARFESLRARGEAGLIVYLTAGDPTLDETPGLIVEAARAGADVIELGVPFSDPSADGPVIQRAMERALASGGAGRQTIARSLAAVAEARRSCDTPICLFGYYNPLYQYGLKRAVEDAARAGVDGLLIVDLPAEEALEIDATIADAGLCRVPLLAPTTTLERARKIVAGAAVTGFVYYVALTGVTGAQHLDLAEVAARTQALKGAVGALPLAVGFGIRDAASAGRVAERADAVVVGSALVEAIARAPDAQARRAAAYQLCSELKAAVANRGARTAG